MPKEKTKAIPDSYYYDRRNKKWKNINKADEIPEKPDNKVLRKWLGEWERSTGYPEQEAALEKLFTELLPTNTDLSDVLIKVCALNDFYSTNIYDVFTVAKKIKEMNIDSELFSDAPHPELVNKLNNEVYENSSPKRHIYSFATKYFSHHKPEMYPIYDSYVDKMLRYYRDKSDFGEVCPFNDKKLLDYEKFCSIVMKFKEFYQLEGTVKDIDKMLWQMGKYHFPKYIKPEKEANINTDTE